jgi:hypothetical protein
MDRRGSNGLSGVGLLALVAALLLAVAGCGDSDDEQPPTCDAATLTGTIDVGGDPEVCGTIGSYGGCDWTVYVDTDTTPANGNLATAAGTIDAIAPAPPSYAIDVSGLGGKYFLYVETPTCGSGYYNADFTTPPAAPNAAVRCGTPLHIKFCD